MAAKAALLEKFKNRPDENDPAMQAISDQPHTSFLEKPFDPNQLLEKTRVLLES